MLKKFVLSQTNVTLQTNKPYEISFRAKGVAMEKLRYHFLSFYQGVTEGEKIERGERGEIRNAGAIIEEFEDTGGDQAHPPDTACAELAHHGVCKLY